MKLTLDALRVIDAIDQTGSFAAAGDALFRVPSAITYSVRKLEEDLGVAIFDRSGRKAVLTSAGREILERGRRLLAEAEELEDRVRRMATGWETELRIAVDDVVGVSTLIPLLKTFYEGECQTSRLRLLKEVYGGPMDAIADGRADIAICAVGELPPEPPLRSMPLGWLQFQFCVAAEHPLASAPDPISADVLKAHRAIVVSDTSRIQPARASGFLPEQDVLAVPSLSAKLDAQLAGLGVGFLPAHTVAPYIADGRLVARDVGIQREPILCKLVWRADRDGRALDWFVRTLQSYEPILSLFDSLVPADDADEQFSE